MIKISAQQKTELVEKLKAYFRDEMDYDIGQFEAEFLLDFFAKDLGAYYYNQGLQDAAALIDNKLEDIQHNLIELEKPTI